MYFNSNSGPYLATVDRKFLTKVKLGNGETYEGVAINTFDPKNHQIIYGGDAPNTREGYNSSESRFCSVDSLDKTLVEGKIVLCDAESDSTGAVIAGADDGSQVFDYYSSIRKPTAAILRSDWVKDELAPSVVSFSSRGPNPITSDILKPDLAAPGVDILAAWPEGNTVTGLEGDDRVVPYNVSSGTSMACPHATAVAAYVKSFNPSWSPAALMSALKTTASPMSIEHNIDAEFAYGSGQLNPAKASDPGLVYDAGVEDYIKFLCGEGYSTKNLRLVTGDQSSCSAATNGSVWSLNFPSFTLSTISGRSVTRVFVRIVTNVGSASSTYKAIVKAQTGMKIRVTPRVLCFKSLGEKKSFVVKVRAKMNENMITGSLVWDDGLHQVRSPIVAHVPPPPPTHSQ